MVRENTISIGIVPARLRQARISRAMSITELAEKMGIYKQSISQYELGISKPSEKTILEYERILNYPRSFFTQPVSDNTISEYSMTFFRSNKNTTLKTKEAADMKLNILSETVEKMEKYLDFPRVNIPNSIEDEDIENFSKKVREYWNLGTGPIKNVIEVLQDNGFVVTRISVGNKKIDAFSKWCKGRPYIVLGEDKKCAVRSRFDACHELYHLLAHIDMTSELVEKRKDQLEREADLFAGAFLMPAESFLKDITSISLDSFISLKKKWKVSIASIIKRCHQLGIISDNQESYLYRQLAYKGYRVKEPFDDVLIPEKPYILKQALELIINSNIVPVYDIESLFNLDEKDIENYFLLEHPLIEKKKDNIIKLRNFI